jgi:SAM-dependent methyltransferase
MHCGYTESYFREINDASRSSASVVVPLVMDLLRPRSVVDFGCGLGEWAQQFRTLGAVEVIGIDGIHINVDDLAISADEFVPADLTLPINLGRRFDLAVSLEVAEHLPESTADQFIATLTRHAPAILFSAAIPHQGGEHHVNEQWPDYWANCFASYGFKAFDVLRHRVWNNSRVEWWYAQNIMIFATADSLDRLLEDGHFSIAPTEILPLVHPQNYTRQLWTQRVLSACLDLAKVVPAGSRLLVADDDLCGSLSLCDRFICPFTERNGHYGGPPADDAAALSELRQQIAAGVDYIVFAWPAFWYLEHYSELARCLSSRHALELKNENIIVYRLNSSAAP